MKRMLCIIAALGLAVAGCETLKPKPEPSSGGDCSTPGGTVPTAPPLQSIPDTGTVPALGKPTHIIVGFCKPRGTYTAAGVDTGTRRFTFVIKGGRGTQEAAFARFYEAGVPVTVYTGDVRLLSHEGASTPPTGGAAPAPPPPADASGGSGGDSGGDSGSDLIYRACISDPPPGGPGPTGVPPDAPDPVIFEKLAWRTAFAVGAVAQTVPPASTLPPPR
ncbi:MAG: hypothetical protein ACJ8AT_22585 [Hyalangium sp.]|uniref:hypothetical protein n=1 Tax=Hyalangium sp. TaxID=2028555 RepID=UPI003899B0E7